MAKETVDHDNDDDDYDDDDDNQNMNIYNNAMISIILSKPTAPLKKLREVDNQDYDAHEVDDDVEDDDDVSDRSEEEDSTIAIRAGNWWRAETYDKKVAAYSKAMVLITKPSRFLEQEKICENVHVTVQEMSRPTDSSGGRD
ncbi:hypothetical protein PoB_004120200 [Plakobranchus ocellatus]|uniref:Uncharacterized protein n=1 Tax=Plakobranchus ocellatus TaxID=259542 RepID=A0AAV4B690_9GAST|nr:hypothetical protein PoB_004120200 [Plakobranchus ocellatus]